MSEPPFVSTLSTGGLLSLAHVGFRPLQQVQGTAVMSLGYQQKPSRWIRGSLSVKPIDMGGIAGIPQVYVPRGSQTVSQYLTEGGWYELEERTTAYNVVRARALARLHDAAREAGALAVVGVRIKRGRFGHASRAIEFTALGTAVASDRFESDGGEQDPIPLVSLGGTDFWKLIESGFWPLGLVGGTSVVYVVSGRRTKRARSRLSVRSYLNQEYGDYTDGLRAARQHAAGRLRREAEQLGAAGVLAIAIGRERHEQVEDNLTVTVDMLGTAVAPLDRAAPPAIWYALGLGKA
jgi:uncharacterized protein YbjQ (UPF0145 family)